MPPIVTALWSVGPAPPRLLSAPARGSTRRMPRVCRSLIRSPVVTCISVLQWDRLKLWASCGYVPCGGQIGIVMQGKKLGAGIVSDGIHHPFALGHESHVEIAVKNTLAARQRWHDVPSFWRHNACHAPVAQGFLQGSVSCDALDLIISQPASRIHDKTTRFKGMVTHRDFDLFTKNRPDQRPGKLRNVDFLVLCHESIACERIVMLPASQSARRECQLLEGLHHRLGPRPCVRDTSG